MRIANIGPGEVIDVVLEYVEEVAWADGEFGLAVPLTLTPNAGADQLASSCRSSSPGRGRPRKADSARNTTSRSGNPVRRATR